MTTPLCRLDDLADPGSAGFAVERDGERQLLLVVRRGGEVFGYRNNCPHLGAPLDWQPGRFLDAERRHILCANHGALFRIEDGLCLSGPCAGKMLAAVPLAIADGKIFLAGADGK